MDRNQILRRISLTFLELNIWCVCSPCHTGFFQSKYPMHYFSMCCNLVIFFIKIIKSYIFLGKLEFLGSHGAGVAKILDIVVRSIKEKGMMCTSPVIDALIQVCQFLGDLNLIGTSFIIVFTFLSNFVEHFVFSSSSATSPLNSSSM